VAGRRDRHEPLDAQVLVPQRVDEAGRVAGRAPALLRLAGQVDLDQDPRPGCVPGDRGTERLAVDGLPPRDSSSEAPYFVALEASQEVPPRRRRGPRLPAAPPAPRTPP